MEEEGKTKETERGWWGGQEGRGGLKVEFCVCLRAYTFKSVYAGANILFLSSRVTHTFPLPSRFRSHPSLQLRINFSVSIWLAPSALLSSPLSALFSFLCHFPPIPPYFFFLSLPSPRLFPLRIVFFPPVVVVCGCRCHRGRCAPFVCLCVRAPICARSAPLYSVRAICLVCL